MKFTGFREVKPREMSDAEARTLLEAGKARGRHNDNLRSQIVGTFIRVLERDPECLLEDGAAETPEHGTFIFRHRDQSYRLSVTTTPVSSSVDVFKIQRGRTTDDVYTLFDRARPFFQWNFSSKQVPKMRRKALILLKKIQLAAVYEIHAA